MPEIDELAENKQIFRLIQAFETKKKHHKTPSFCCKIGSRALNAELANFCVECLL